MFVHRTSHSKKSNEAKGDAKAKGGNQVGAGRGTPNCLNLDTTVWVKFATFVWTPNLLYMIIDRLNQAIAPSKIV